jgi:hypothetical protein
MWPISGSCRVWQNLRLSGTGVKPDHPVEVARKLGRDGRIWPGHCSGLTGKAGMKPRNVREFDTIADNHHDKGLRP